MHITINLDEEIGVCPSQKIDIADTVNQIVMPGDLPTNTTLTLTDVSESDIATKVKGLHRAGSVLEFTLKIPEGSQYTENFALKMSYANGVSSDDIYYYVELSHLSKYGVFGKDEEEAEDKSSKKVITVEGEDDDSNITDESSKEDDSSEIAISVENHKDKKVVFFLAQPLEYLTGS